MKKLLLFIFLIIMKISLASDIKLENDAALSVFKLDNGFTICIYPNKEPPNRVSMRLVVASGSTSEKDGQEGLAHFIEHMAFNGTKNFPSGEMIKYFQRLGMAFGADTNAHTGFTETVYKIDIPESSQKLLHDGMLLLRDYADGILFEDADIEKERGVILAEKKLRDTAEYRKFVNSFQYAFNGSKFGNNFPIGTEDAIKSFRKKDFFDFYNAKYTADNMALIVVGDISVSDIESLARDMFSSMQLTKKISEKKEKFSPKDISKIERLFIKESTLKNSSVTLSFVSPVLIEEDTLEKYEEFYKFYVITKILNMRFAIKLSKSDAKILSGNASFSELGKYASIFFISVESPMNKVLDAYSEALELFLNIKKYGFGESELNRAKAEVFKELENEINKKSTKQTVKIANELASAFADEKVFTSPELDLKIAKKFLENFSVKDADKFFNNMISKSKCYQFLADSGDEPTEQSYKSALDIAESKSQINSKLDSKGLEFCEMGDGGKIIAEKIEKNLDVIQLSFENGIKANLKKTDFSKDEILISIAFGGGKLDIPNAKGLEYAPMVVMLGGTKYQTYGEIEVAKSDKTLSYKMNSENGYFVFDLKTNKKDFQCAMKFARTQIQYPRFSEDALKVFKINLKPLYRQLDTQVEAAFSKVNSWLCDNNFRLSIPKEEDVLSLTVEDFKNFFEPILNNSYMEVTIVGDFEVDYVKQILSETFGSMPKRENKRKNYSKEEYVNFQKYKDLTIKVNNNDDDKAFVTLIWPTCAREDIQKMRAANVLGEVFSDVLMINLRENDGKVYSPIAYNNSNETFRNFGYLCAGSIASVQYEDDVVKSVEKSAQEILNGITEDQFVRAKAPLLKYIEKVRRSNSYWANQTLTMSQGIPLKLEIAKTFESGYEELTLDDINSVAKEYLINDKKYEVRIIPTKGN